MNTTPKWTEHLGVNDATTFSAKNGGRFFKTTLVEGGQAAVIVKGKIRRGDVARGLLVELPAAINDRLAAMVIGPHAPGVVGVLEWALAELESRKATLIIGNAD